MEKYFVLLLHCDLVSGERGQGQQLAPKSQSTPHSQSQPIFLASDSSSLKNRLHWAAEQNRKRDVAMLSVYSNRSCPHLPCIFGLPHSPTPPPPPPLPPPPPRCSLPTSLPLLSSAAPAVFPIVAQPALPLTAHPFDQYLLLGEQIVDSEAKCCLRSKFDLSFVVLESFGGQASPSLVKYRDSCSPSINKVSTTYQQNIITK